MRTFWRLAGLVRVPTTESSSLLSVRPAQAPKQILFHTTSVARQAMGSRKQYIVAVTGSGGFKEHDENPSATVRDKLPELIEREGLLPIKVLKYHFDFRNMLVDMERIPKLWNQKLDVYDSNATHDETIFIDGMIHMGMKDTETRWVIERQARRDGYDWVGDDDKPIPPKNGEPGGMFEDIPELLKPMFDVDAISEAVKVSNPDIPFAVSDDCGLKYCELQFMTSLATLYRRKEKARVLYFHVTGGSTQEDIKRGVSIGTSLITTMIDAYAEVEDMNVQPETQEKPRLS